jgi:hypothetical protein
MKTMKTRKRVMCHGFCVKKRAAGLVVTITAAVVFVRYNIITEGRKALGELHFRHRGQSRIASDKQTSLFTASALSQQHRNGVVNKCIRIRCPRWLSALHSAAVAEDVRHNQTGQATTTRGQQNLDRSDPRSFCALETAVPNSLHVSLGSTPRTCWTQLPTISNYEKDSDTVTTVVRIKGH